MLDVIPDMVLLSKVANALSLELSTDYYTNSVIFYWVFQVFSFPYQVFSVPLRFSVCPWC